MGRSLVDGLERAQRGASRVEQAVSDRRPTRGRPWLRSLPLLRCRITESVHSWSERVCMPISHWRIRVVPSSRAASYTYVALAIKDTYDAESAQPPDNRFDGSKPQSTEHPVYVCSLCSVEWVR